MPESFTLQDLTDVIARTLGLTVGDGVELQRDKTNSNRILIVRHPKSEAD